ncbi:MAG: DUF4038 domain-containing protein [Planctomycetes bacterium]|nr:DUF4038 domain-containing protein [Planctomycetota bacterium]
MPTVEQWRVFETHIESNGDYANPFLDVDVKVHFTAPSGRAVVIDGFWDEGPRWGIRFSPDEVGEWEWRTESSVPDDADLHNRTGSFQCVPYEGDNPLYRHGPVRLSANRLHFEHADGTKFFWLADTAWNGVLRSTKEDWSRYLKTRREQRFTAIQFVSTQWRGLKGGPHDGVAFVQGERLELNPHFFEHLDPRVKAINGHGLVAAPVILWAFREGDPGVSLSEEDAIRVARYIVARWGAYQVVWILGGDGHYEGERSERWKRIGRAVFGERRDRLVTMHPCGQSWVADEFNGEEWFDFIGYQSGHGSSEKNLRWLTEGPPAANWRRDPSRPVINLEPNYEAISSYQEHVPFTDREVRRAAYWSLLVSPTAGVTYGHNSIWVWNEKAGPADGHERLGDVPPWQEGLMPPGAQSMAVLHRFFANLPWWTLRPAPELLAEQPGENDPRRFVAAAMAEEETLALLYLPCGGEVRLKLDVCDTMERARWFNPRAEEWTEAGSIAGEYTAPDDMDWMLVIDKGDGL